MHSGSGLKKRGEGAINRIIVIVLIILVILVVFVFIFRNDLIDWMRNLPGYDSEVEDIEIEGVDEVTLDSMCPVRVARFSSKGELLWCTDRDSYCRDTKDTSLYFGGENKIYESSSSLWIIRLFNRKKIGTVEGKKINIEDYLFTSKVTIAKDDSVGTGFFRELEGSYFLGSFQLICRDNEIVKLEPGSVLDMENIPSELVLKTDGSNFKVFTNDYGSDIFVDSEWKITRIRGKYGESLKELFVEK
jgi:hypothetical protein